MYRGVYYVNGVFCFTGSTICFGGFTNSTDLDYVEKYHGFFFGSTHVARRYVLGATNPSVCEMEGVMTNLAKQLEGSGHTLTLGTLITEQNIFTVERSILEENYGELALVPYFLDSDVPYYLFNDFSEMRAIRTILSMNKHIHGVEVTPADKFVDLVKTTLSARIEDFAKVLTWDEIKQELSKRKPVES